jgi:hypothetical protein
LLVFFASGFAKFHGASDIASRLHAFFLGRQEKYFANSAFFGKLFPDEAV